MKRTFLTIVLLNLGLLNFPVQAQTAKQIRSGEIRLNSLSVSVDSARAEYGKLKDKLRIFKYSGKA